MNAIARPSAAARLDRLPISSFHRDMVKLLAYIFFFELGDLNSFAFAAPGVREHWHLTIDTISTITSASFVGMFIGATTGGWFSDRVGRRRALVVTTLWYSGFSLLNAFAWDTASLFATRLLTGVGLSSMTVVAMTYISEMFPAKLRGRYQAIILTIGLCGIPVTAYCRPIHHSRRAMGLAGRVRLGIARDGVPVLCRTARGIAAVVRASGPPRGCGRGHGAHRSARHRRDGQAA